MHEFNFKFLCSVSRLINVILFLYSVSLMDHLRFNKSSCVVVVFFLGGGVLTCIKVSPIIFRFSSGSEVLFKVREYHFLTGLPISFELS